jgi:hypothetical protein
VTQGLVPTFGPAPIAPELLKLIGGGTTTTTTAPTPQAPKNTW